MRGVIVCLTQNTPERRGYLHQMLYFLFRYFVSRYEYPVVVVHQGDLHRKDQDRIRSGIRRPYDKLVSFRRIRPVKPGRSVARARRPWGAQLAA